MLGEERSAEQTGCAFTDADEPERASRRIRRKVQRGASEDHVDHTERHRKSEERQGPPTGETWLRQQKLGRPSTIKQIVDLLVCNKEPFNNNDWQRSPWPARPYTTIQIYEVAADAGEAHDKAALLSGIAHGTDSTEAVTSGSKAQSIKLPSPCQPQATPLAGTYDQGGASRNLPPTDDTNGLVRNFVSQQCTQHARSIALESLPPPLVMGADVEERPAWGLDCYTYRAVKDALACCAQQAVEAKLDAESIDGFISNALIPALNRQGSQGWNICAALQDIQRTFSADSAESHAAKFLSWAIPHVEGFCKDGIPSASKPCTGNSTVAPSHFKYWRVHPKGQGIFAKRRILKGTFIHEYLGELYSPWRWFEKQDLLRKKQPNQVLPDFYNMSLERPKELPGGSSVAFVEAADRGNYASRLSHSCGPNCRNVAVVVGSVRITNALFTTRDIEPGQELCWDYACVTESEKEFRAATCLCASPACRGSFLCYANSTTFQMIMQKQHDILDRNAVLVRACSQNLTDTDLSRLRHHGIGAAALGDCSPPWLAKWAALVLEFIEAERRQLPCALLKANNHNFETVEVDAEGVKENRLQNLAITLDKINFFLRHQSLDLQKEPPLTVLSPTEVLDFLWEGPHSVKVRAVAASSEHFRSAGFKLRAAPQHMKAAAEIHDFDKVRVVEVNDAREKLLLLAGNLRDCGPSSTGLADTLVLTAQTETFFTATKYDNVRPEISDPSGSIKANRRGQKGTTLENKLYRPAYVWAQCTAWFKQTVYDPTASLSAERRGILSLPDIETAYTGSANKEPFAGKQRQKLLAALVRSPCAMWPTSLPFSFKNNQKVYGSVMLDAAIRCAEEGRTSEDLAVTDRKLTAVLTELLAAY